MPFNINVPKSSGTPLIVPLDNGDNLFILGANGVGKSSLMHSLAVQNLTNVRRITAHRQTWFQSNAINITPQGRRDLETNIRDQDRNQSSRFTEEYTEARASRALYDIVNAENIRARQIAAAAEADNQAEVKKLVAKEAPLKTMNRLFRLSNMPIEITIQNDDQLMARKNGGVPYSIAEMSDGERNALLIGANVLTVNPGTLILIDEPERHLHRSIVSPLLSLLFAERADCAFVVSTHEMMLPIDNPKSKTLLVRNCTYSGRDITAWDADFINSDQPIDANIKSDILGSKRKVLFVEGTEQSLDKPLYSLIFPDISILPKSGSRDVEQAVTGIRSATDLVWMKPFGIVDNDRRPATEVTALKTKGVYALSVFSVESIYYNTEVQRFVAEAKGNINGKDAPTRLAEAKAAALQAISTSIPHLSQRIAEKKVREKIFANLPKKGQIASATPIAVNIDTPAVLAAEVSRLATLVTANNLAEIIEKYPVRETLALSKIAKHLGYTDRNQYETEVRKLLISDNTALTYVRNLFGTLPADITAS